MKVLTLLNEKGGVGKTTLATHIAMGCAARGMRVMLIDGDPQGHATLRCKVKRAPRLYDLLVREEDWGRTAVIVPPEQYGVPGDPLPTGRLYVVASNTETRSIQDNVSNPYELRNRLSEIEQRLDLVVVDTSPTPSLLHGLFYLATDYILYPTEAAFGSFTGLSDSLQRLPGINDNRANNGAQPIQVMGIVTTKYRGNTLEQRDNFAALQDQFGAMVWQPIPMATLWTETEATARPVYALEPSSTAAGHAWELIDQVQGVIRYVAS